MNPDTFDIISLAKLMIKVEPILEGSFSDQNKIDLEELKIFVNKSNKFKSYYESITNKEREKIKNSRCSNFKFRK